MPLTIDIDTENDSATPTLSALAKNLSDPGALEQFHNRIAAAAEIETRNYLRTIAGARHATAARLGARPTGILERAADSAEGRGTRDRATVTIRPGEVLARVNRDVVITPGAGKKYLTIPVAAAAYGRRAREIPDLFFLRVGPRKTPVLAKRGANANLIIYYVLVTRVTQPQDRTLLPSDDAYLALMEEEAEAYLLEDADD